MSSRAAAGDRAAFDELYRRYAGPLTAYGARMLRDRGAGENIAQTTFLSAFRALERGVEPRNVRPWLFKIAHNAAPGSIRRERDVPVEFVDRPQLDDLEPRAARRSLTVELARSQSGSAVSICSASCAGSRSRRSRSSWN